MSEPSRAEHDACEEEAEHRRELERACEERHTHIFEGNTMYIYRTGESLRVPMIGSKSDVDIIYIYI